MGTSSLDTTCTIWDIEKETVDTQLIAHDKEVYDIAWGGPEVFASVSADGSVRVFDLRDKVRNFPNHHTPPLRLPILVPEGTIPSALTVYSYTLRETDTFFAIVSGAPWCAAGPPGFLFTRTYFCFPESRHTVYGPYFSVLLVMYVALPVLVTCTGVLW